MSLVSTLQVIGEEEEEEELEGVRERLKEKRESADDAVVGL